MLRFVGVGTLAQLKTTRRRVYASANLDRNRYDGSVRQVLAKEDFKEKHPRRAEVNKRVRNQDKRIQEGLASGKLTPAQAKQLQGERSGSQSSGASRK